MKIRVIFKHDKKNDIDYASVASYFFGKDSSTGPVVEKGNEAVWTFDVKEGDTIEFATTQFQDEFDLKHIRRKRVVNGVSQAKMDRDFAKYKRDVKAGKIKPIQVLDMKKLSPAERKKVRKAQRTAKAVMNQDTGRKRRRS